MQWSKFFSLNWKPPDNFHPCQHLAGLNLKVTYNPAAGKPYIGEVISVEVRQ